MDALEPFLRRIEDDPLDADAYLALSGWLLAHGHPAGEIIAVQAARERFPEDARLKAREDNLLGTHARLLLGRVLERQAAHLEVSWRRGFLAHVRLSVTPAMSKEGVHPFELVQALFQIPWSRALKRLDLAKMRVGSRNDYRPALEALQSTGRHATLQTLAIGHVPPITHCGSRSTTVVGPLLGLAAACPRLRTLYVRGGEIDLAGMGAMPALERLIIDTDELPAIQIRTLAHTAMPALNELYLHSGTVCHVEVDDLLVLLDRAVLPSLNRIRFSGGFATDRVLDALTRSDLVAQLESIDLHDGIVGDRGAVALKAAAPAMSRLQKLDLTNCAVSADIKRELAHAFPSGVDLAMSLPPEPDPVAETG